jgi:hypothetical protein
MASSAGSNSSDPVRTTQPGQELQDAIVDLTQFFNIDTIPECEKYTIVECTEDVSGKLDLVRKEFMKEFKEVSIGSSILIYLLRMH